MDKHYRFHCTKGLRLYQPGLKAVLQNGIAISKGPHFLRLFEHIGKQSTKSLHKMRWLQCCNDCPVSVKLALSP